MQTVDQIIDEALKLWLDEVDSGSPEYCVKAYGLCDWVVRFAHHARYNGLEARSRLKTMFNESDLSETYPFGNESSFVKELTDDTFHLNESRVQWVRNHLNKKG